MATIKYKVNGVWVDIPTIRGPRGITPEARGQYSLLTEYKFFDWVTDSGSSYLYINEINSIGVPLTDVSHWQQIAAKGDTGPQGEQGEQGPKGDPGEVSQAQMESAISAAVDPVQMQIDTLVVEGDSSVEAAQARVPASGEPFVTLKDRLDAGDSKLAVWDTFIPYGRVRDIYVGENLFSGGNLTLGDGWTYSEGVLTHTAAATENATLAFDGVNDDDYLLEFTTSYATGEFIKCAIGNGYPHFAYNGTSSIVMPLKCWGSAILNLIPYGESTTVAFTMSNIRLRRIQETGTKVTLNYISAVTQENKSNYGNRNVILGYDSATKATGSTRLVAIGNAALKDLKGGHRNIAIGGSSLQNMVGGNGNIAIGADAAIYTQEGEDNIAIGMSAMGMGKQQKGNIAIGRYAHLSNDNAESEYNVSIGYLAGGKTTNDKNVAIGYMAGYQNATGKNNVFVGADTYNANVGNYNLFIGSGAYNTNAGCSESIGIGHAARPTKSNQCVIGSNAITEVVFCGNKKINFNVDGTVTWETLS